MGVPVSKSVVAAILVGLLCAGCANATLSPSLGSGNSFGNGLPGVAGTATGDTGAVGESEVPRKTIASKVLAAIALERVTGRKPDPARFSEVD